jgi:hypothetical protein
MTDRAASVCRGFDTSKGVKCRWCGLRTHQNTTNGNFRSVKNGSS